MNYESYLSVKTMAKLWNVSPRRITEYCVQGRILGAVKENGKWKIPSGAKQPSDNRSVFHNREIKPMPIGFSNFIDTISNYYYVDKSLLIKDILDEKSQAYLFTRPRRFGKSLNMDMLKTFFEHSDHSTALYFENLKIWSAGEKYRQYQGKYPVIYLSFAELSDQNWDSVYQSLKRIICLEAARHDELMHSPHLNEVDSKLYQSMIHGDLSSTDMAFSLKFLTRWLYQHHGIKPIILIDEYDAPVQLGFDNGFYDQVLSFMRPLFMGGFKDNPYLELGVLSGILRVAKESIFSGLNNLNVYSLLDDRYSEYFGFTPEEVKQMCDYYGVAEKYDEVCRWYDGYTFGNHRLFNPWSVINYFNRNCVARTYWQNVSINTLIKRILSNSNRKIYDQMCELLSDGSLTLPIDTNVVYPNLETKTESIFSFLVVTGYLNAQLIETVHDGLTPVFKVNIPNLEIKTVFRREILEYMDPLFDYSTIHDLEQAMQSGKPDRIKYQLEHILVRSVSYFDTANESFYHGLTLGLCAVFSDYQVRSIRESGMGRFDLLLYPKKVDLPCIIIELKQCDQSEPDYLRTVAKKAVRQINEKKYFEDDILIQNQSIILYGMAFSGKNVAIEASVNSANAL